MIGARTAYEESLELLIEVAHRSGIPGADHNLGLMAYAQGVYERATALFLDALAEFSDLSDQRGVAECRAGW